MPRVNRACQAAVFKKSIALLRARPKRPTASSILISDFVFIKRGFAGRSRPPLVYSIVPPTLNVGTALPIVGACSSLASSSLASSSLLESLTRSESKMLYLQSFPRKGVSLVGELKPQGPKGPRGVQQSGVVTRYFRCLVFLCCIVRTGHNFGFKKLSPGS